MRKAIPGVITECMAEVREIFLRKIRGNAQKEKNFFRIAR
jgi:hypothetical protein